MLAPTTCSFQFIGFPSEWGDYECEITGFSSDGFQFIGFPSEWGDLKRRVGPGVAFPFPIYWVPQRVGRPPEASRTIHSVSVSNLLGSPASGEPLCPGSAGLTWQNCYFGFPIYWVPQRVGSLELYSCKYFEKRFPIYWVPQRVGSSGCTCVGRPAKVFPIYWVPQRVGSPDSTLVLPNPQKFPIYWVPQRVGRPHHPPLASGD